MPDCFQKFTLTLKLILCVGEWNSGYIIPQSPGKQIGNVSLCFLIFASCFTILTNFRSRVCSDIVSKIHLYAYIGNTRFSLTLGCINFSVCQDSWVSIWNQDTPVDFIIEIFGITVFRIFFVFPNYDS